MMTVRYITGDATQPTGDKPRIIVHVCNDIGGWGRGFVLALSSRWDSPERAYRAWFEQKSDLPFELGQVAFVEVEPQLWVGNMIGQRDTRKQAGVPPVRYEAIRTALGRVGEFAIEHAASVHMPRIGCGLAGGDWSEIETIIEDELCQRDVDVTVYDLDTQDA
jgi:O-acetyl-ADP-ribose deacetylase (regulator of RNase III)